MITRKNLMGLRQMLDQLEREAIDTEFMAMATDTRYQQEAKAVNEEFAGARWEAFQIGEYGCRSGS